jgi:hypothetical protein
VLSAVGFGAVSDFPFALAAPTFSLSEAALTTDLAAALDMVFALTRRSQRKDQRQPSADKAGVKESGPKQVRSSQTRIATL